LDIIKISHIDHLDASLEQDLKFYAPFLAMYAFKIKRDRILEDRCFDVDSLENENEEWKEKLIEIMYKE
jgi:hypothetical protein